MTTKPRFRVGRHLLPGVIAVALFGVFTAIIATSSFDEAIGFPEGVSVIANIGFALLNIDAGYLPAEGFLVALIALAVVLDAALGGAVMLAWREDEEGDEE